MMNKLAQSSSGQFTIKAVAQATGLSVETLRAWERRYEVVAPSRDSSGRRTYSAADVARLRLLRTATELGHTISRLAPLSMGRLVDDVVQCGYHGMEYDCSGQCVRVPGQDKIPKTAKVRSFPLVERYNAVWIWTGNPALADPEKIMVIEHYGEPGWKVLDGG